MKTELRSLMQLVLWITILSVLIKTMSSEYLQGNSNLEVNYRSLLRSRITQTSEREKREASTVRNGFTFEEKVAMVRNHNDKRSLAKATAMLHMVSDQITT